MTFQQLQYIQQIARTGSLSGAARNLFVSSSSVSISLNILEKELGYPLFDRTAKGFIPTQRGALVLDYADQILHTHSLLCAVKQSKVRTLRINSTDQPCIAKAFAQLLWENKDRTDLRIENISYSGAQIQEKMLEHALDVSLSSSISYNVGYTERWLQKTGLHQQVLKHVPAVITVGPGHRLYDAQRVTPHDLRNESYIDDPHIPLGKNNSFGGNLYVDLNKVIYIARPGIRKEVLLRGMGYSLGVMPPKQSQSKLRNIPLEGAFFQFNAITNTQTPAQPEIMRFLQLAKQNLDEAYPEY